MDNPTSFLSLYGLDQIVAAQDDPYFWASVVSTYWPLPADAKMEPAKYHFGVGYASRDTEMRIQPTQAWAFERVDANRLRLRDCPTSRVSDALIDNRLQSLVPFSLLYCFSAEYWPYGAIVITCPSQHQKEAFAFAGFQVNGRTGWGETKVWRFRPSAKWEALETVAQWVS